MTTLKKTASTFGLFLRPWRIVHALRHRVRHQASWRIRYHRVLAAACRLTGKKFIADLDWYEYATLNLSKTIAGCGALNGKFVIRRLPRNFVFELNSPNGSDRDKTLKSKTYKQQVVGNLNLWDICRVSIAKELGHLPSEKVDEEELKTIDKYYHWARQCYNGVVAYLDKVKPHMVVVFQGGFYDSRIILECAKHRGIRVIAIENCFLEKYAFIDSYSGFILNRHSLAEQGQNLYKSINCKSNKFDPIKFWKEQSSFKGPDHRTGGGDIESLALPSDKKIILLISQVASDASIVLDSTIYTSTADFILDVCNVISKHPDWFLVVRLHPKEAWHVNTAGQLHEPGEYLWDNTLQSLQKSGYIMPKNCIIISGPQINTHQLMERASIGVTINSQAGLEMLLLGKPMVTAGRCFYSKNGFTYDLFQKSDLESKIIEAMQAGLTDSAKEELYEFSSYLFDHYLLPKDLLLSVQKVNRLREILV
jgi:hypothetical protein